MCQLSPKHLDGTDERSLLPLQEKYSDASAKIPDSTLHKSSSCRAQEERAALDPLIGMHPIQQELMPFIEMNQNIS